MPPKGKGRVPVWLLDVDNVINVFGNGEEIREEWGGDIRSRKVRSVADGRRFTIEWPPALTAWIQRLRDSGLVEVRWLSTWGVEANTRLGALFGLEWAAVAGTKNEAVKVRPVRFSQAEVDWWKLEFAQRTVEELGEEGRVVWTDDEIWEWDEAKEWAEGERASGRLLPVAPAGGGLTPRMMERIEDWLRSPRP